MSSDSNVYENYLLDLGFLLKEYAVAAKQRYLFARGTDEEAKASEYLYALGRVISLMQHQAEVFDIPLDKLSLHNINEQFFINDASEL